MWRRSGSRPRGPVVPLALALLLGAALSGGCATDPAPPPAADAPAREPVDGSGRRITLTVGVFGTFGLQEAGLYDTYMRLHPDIAVRQTSLARNDVYYPQLLTHLTAGSGLADVQAVEVGNISEVLATQGGRLDELGSAPGVDRNAFLPWKWAQGTGSDGRTLALGTDIGPQAVCYRKDLFARAGLPTERTAVGRLWAGDWRKYLATGVRYRERAPEGTAFTDSASGVMAAVTGSAPLAAAARRTRAVRAAHRGRGDAGRREGLRPARTADACAVRPGRGARPGRGVGWLRPGRAVWGA
ncbi:extracellular solute-binding protein [Streptomyces sp. NBC_00090]|uniref:extracellular solute-binding protein n=1 Tax=Streptomyces sp. NBC_00090 TaxID=2903619 RepID=UPI003870D997